MKAENTTCIRVYLRYQNAEDRELQRRLNADREQGRALSATVRDALRAYYFSPAPPPAPEVQTLAHEVHELSDLVYQLAHEVQQLRAQTAELDAVRTQNAQLQNLLLAATFGDRAMKRTAAEVAHSLTSGQDGLRTYAPTD
jgi:phage shock protein A